MFRTILWLLGGLSCAIGVLCLLFSFGTPYANPGMEHWNTDMATTLSSVGWDAVGDVGALSPAPVAFLCLALGLPILVGLNATAWKKTGGY